MTQATLTERPDNCECWGTSQDLPCAVCYIKGGFETPNPQPPEGDAE